MMELNVKSLDHVTGGLFVNKQKINNASFNGTRFDASLNNLNGSHHDTITITGNASTSVGNAVGGSMTIS